MSEILRIKSHSSRGFSLDLEDTPWDTNWVRFRKLIFTTLTDQHANITAWYWNKFMQLLILVVLLSYVLETVNSLSMHTYIWEAVDIAAIIIFSLEYFGKIIFIPKYSALPNMMLSTGWVIDFITLVPFYIQFFFDYMNSSHLGILRLTRILRVYRFFKLSYAPRQSQIFVIAFLRSKDALMILVYVITVFVIVFSTFIYYAEMTIETPLGNKWVYTSGLNAGTVSPFQNILDSIWYTLETASVVGYGDVIPSSVFGKIVGVFIALSGLFMFAFPISTLSIRMNEVYSEFLKSDTAKRHLKENIVPAKKRIKWENDELSPEQEELVTLMLEDLFETEDTIKKFKKNIEHTKRDLFTLRHSLASFGRMKKENKSGYIY
eukprot:NODE_308_length_11287_cov_0.209778.p3 type:complete len:377 gc:universal NODE_308_length_11287_cov_0.209778:8917-10047(+)